MSYPADPHWANVKNLLHFDGINGGKRIADEKNNAVYLGSTAVLSSTQRKFGNTSFYGDGTNQGYGYAQTAFQWAAKDVTVEFWVYPLAQTGATPYAIYVSSTFTVIVSSTTYPNKVAIALGGSVVMVSASNIQYDTWSHIAFTRTAAGGGIKLYINGVVEASANSAFEPNITTNINFGGISSEINAFRGYIADLRYTQGVNRYPTAFTPPTAAFPGSGVVDPYYDKVVLLMHCNGEQGTYNFVDQKGNAFTPLSTGSAPYHIRSSAVYYKYGASGIMFGSALKLKSNDFILGSDDFTLEYWIYKTEISTATNFHWKGADGVSSAFKIFSNASQSMVYIAINGTVVLSANIYTGNVQLAVTRNGGNIYLYRDGTRMGTYAIGVGTNIVTDGTFYIGGDEVAGSNAAMDEIRFTKGYCRYPTPYVAPTEPFPDAGPNFLSGTVLDSNNTPLARTVRAFRRSDSLLTDATVSDATTGAFELRATDMSEHYVLVFDDNRNAMVYDHIEPVV